MSKKKAIITILMSACVILLASSNQTSILRQCTRVIDGDTIVLDGNETVRLIGVDCPETKDPRRGVQYFGEEALVFVKNLVEGKSVYLEYDQDKKDKYGRTLAYVYLADGIFVNAEIIKQGIGFAYIKYPFKYLEDFFSLEREARIKEVGFWSHQKSGSQSTPAKTITPLSLLSTKSQSTTSQNADITVYVTRTGSKYHTASCRYAKNASPMSLKDAVARGLTPCAICKPPTLK